MWFYICVTCTHARTLSLSLCVVRHFALSLTKWKKNIWVCVLCSMRVGWLLVSSNDRYFILTRCSYAMISNGCLLWIKLFRKFSIDCTLHTSISRASMCPWPIILVLVVTHAALNFHSNSISSSIENSRVELKCCRLKLSFFPSWLLHSHHNTKKFVFCCCCCQFGVSISIGKRESTFWKWQAFWVLPRKSENRGNTSIADDDDVYDKKCEPKVGQSATHTNTYVHRNCVIQPFFTI